MWESARQMATERAATALSATERISAGRVRTRKISGRYSPVPVEVQPIGVEVERKGVRTLDLCIANAALSQLSYRPN